MKNAKHDGEPLSVAEAQKRIAAEVSVVGIEGVELSDAPGRILREEIVANRNVPGEDNSSMDGYAVRAVDVAQAPVLLPVVADRRAGVDRDDILGPGEAVRIMTGASMPRGADSVVPFELTDCGVANVQVNRPVAEGANIRRVGEDMKLGAVILQRGTRISAGEIGALATLQRRTVQVSRRPAVAILATGDELAGLDQDLGPGRIVNSNSHALAALVRQAGAVPRLLDVIPDSLEATVAALEQAADSDMIVSTGGVSVGVFDFVKEAILVLGGRLCFWRVNMKPGRPVAVSKLLDRLHFGLPGNPVSCMVGFHLFVAPAIRLAMGSRHVDAPRLDAVLTAELRSSGDRPAYQRVRLSAGNGRLLASPMRHQGSGVSTSMAGANGLAEMAQGVTSIGKGDTVRVLLIDAMD
jgi:molybdopterin molybdotransferase